jgi:hypothetical protein
MARVLRDINVGMAAIVGVCSGYYIFEPEIRKQEIRRRELEEEMHEISEKAREPYSTVKEQVMGNKSHAPFTRWLLYRN